MTDVPITNRRQYPRFSIVGRIPSEIFDSEGHELTFFPVDVSANGLGLILDLPVSRGQQLTMKVLFGDQRMVALEVVWVAKTHDVLDIYRCGLRLVSEGDLKELFETCEAIMLEDLS